jgi:lysophospholipase L1-like esterase
MQRDDGKNGRINPEKKIHGRGLWSNRLVRSAAVASVVVAAVLAGGFIYGTYAALGGSVGDASSQHDNHVGSSGVAPTPSPQSKTLHLVALGDSLTHGLGDASGRGYVGDVSEQYRQIGYTVIQSNLGIDGLTSNGLLNAMKQSSVQNLLQSANVILISIGGNDLNGAAGLPLIDSQRIATAEAKFSTNITTILSAIRSVNGTAPIALVGLYNPYSGVSSAAHQTNAIVQSWVVREEQITATFPQTVVVQTFDLFQLNPSQFLYVDHFHPNQAGYQRIADRVWQDLQGK